ncbi:hypothetical protein G7Z17_g2839 [Cylindrodendrum hubeiense]|uniref:Ribosomal RNA methyltransferase FtsJ domain-containing protein n=1 Tax=Cylindrodendrum hubeiense TaxID=595255 RepID=A0A9P5LKL4_9HYPO|nr:hypothetical protein G7Z17_g2839 [Cylindrodendrum hubeiense]
MASNETKEGVPTSRSQEIIMAYLSERIVEYRELTTLRRQGWQDPGANDHFENERQHADHPDETTKTIFYKMTLQIGKGLDAATGILSSPSTSSGNLAILDLCMAPGGFTTTALNHPSNRHVRGISLPVEMGGYEVRIPNWERDNRISIKFLDITMLAAEMGVDIETEIPATHPDAGRFSPERPFEDEEFDVIFCGGAVVRNHKFAEYRQGHEKIRLETSQLVLALQRIRKGATLVLVLHRADASRSVDVIHRFSGFAKIQLFKPPRAHARKSSFYMVARNVQPQKTEAKQAIEDWKRQWRDATLTTEPRQHPYQLFDPSPEHTELVLREFGETLVQLSRPIFRIQANALHKAPWNTNKSTSS